MDPLQRPLSLSGDPAGPLAHGDGPVGVALFHGFTSGPLSVTPWAEALAAAGADVVAPLLPGHGTHWEDLEQVSAARWREEARDTVDDLLRDHPAVFAAGLSMGGALALDAAAHRDLAGTVVVNPALRFASPAAPFAGVLKHVVRSVAPIANDTVDPAADERAYPRTPVAAVEQLGLLQSAILRQVPRVSAPVLVFRSTTDHVVPDSSVVALGRRLAPGLLTLRPLYNSYHVATLDQDAPVIHAESVAFMLRVLARAPGGRRG